MPEPGDQIGDFELIREISRGGVGVVYEARQVSLDRPVALKLLFSADGGDERWKDRFLAEAAEVAKLSHPGILQVHAMGEHEGRPWFAMELVQGHDLRGVIESKGRLPPLQAAELVRDAARALHHAHESGLVHRDVKPENLMLRKDGRVCVTDFGLAKRMDSLTRTTTGALLGTPYYMSPESIAGDGDASGPLIDVYGLGVTLFELLVGRPPFQSENVVELLKQIVEEDPPRPRSLVPEIPAALESITLAAMARDPKDRPPSAASLADLLDAVVAAERADTGAVSGPLPTVTVRRQRPPLFAFGGIAAAGVLIAVAAGFALGWFNGRGSTPEARTPGPSDPPQAPPTAVEPDGPAPDASTPTEAGLGPLADELAAAQEVRAALASDDAETVRRGREALGGLLASVVESLGLDFAPLAAADWATFEPGRIVVSVLPADANVEKVEVIGLPTPGAFKALERAPTEPGLYRIVAVAKGHVPTLATVVLPPGGTAEVVLRLPPVGEGKAVGTTHHAGIWLPSPEAPGSATRSEKIAPFFLHRELFTKVQHARTTAESGAEIDHAGDEHAPALVDERACCDVDTLRDDDHLPTPVEMRLATLLATVATLARDVPPTPSAADVEKLLKKEGLGDGLAPVWVRQADGRVRPFSVGEDDVPPAAEGAKAALRFALDVE